MWCCVTAWKGSVTLIIVNQTQLHCPTKKGKKWKKNLPLSFCCVSDATPDLRYNDWEENKTAWIRGTCTHFCCSQQKVKGGQAPHSIVMPLFFTELKSRDTFQVIIGFLTIVIYTRAFGPTECWGSPLSLSKSLFKAKARSLGSHAWFFATSQQGVPKDLTAICLWL